MSDSLIQQSKIDYAVDIVDLSKQFNLGAATKGGYATFKSIFLRKNLKTSKITEVKDTYALKDITLRVPKGVSFGVIGRNGSGKSTLLKLITGIYKPTKGVININGKIAALIELGAGFHPDFTGRENIFLGAAVYGLKRDEIKKRFDDIVNFAELHQVIDSPVRTYSSGMYMRLGFSVAVHTDPDILLIDEVLSVGDASFVTKCEDKLAELKKRGTTLMVVSHDLRAVEQWCDEALWIDRGVVKDRGNPRRVIDHYREFIEKGESEALSQKNSMHKEHEQSAINEPEENAISQEANRWGSREIEITDVRILDENNKDKNVFHLKDKLILELDYSVNEDKRDLVFGVAFNRADGVLVSGTNTDIEKIEIHSLNKSGTIQYVMNEILLNDGIYSVDVAVHAKDGYPYDYQKAIRNFSVRTNNGVVGVINPNHSWTID